MAAPHFIPEPDPQPLGDVLDAAEAQRYLRLGSKKFEEIRPRLPLTRLGHRTDIFSRRLLLEWVEANAEISDPRQLNHRKRA